MRVSFLNDTLLNEHKLERKITIEGESLRPRFKFSKIKGREFFNEHTRGYDIDCIRLAKDMGWELLIQKLRGEEGYTLYVPKTGRYQIIMDNKGNPSRNKFTLAHEMGHIILEHFIDFDVNTLTEEECEVLDIEASVVAGELLMPYKYIKAWNTDFETMKFKFGVSKSALETRLKFLQYEI